MPEKWKSWNGEPITTDDPMTGNDAEHLQARIKAEDEFAEWVKSTKRSRDKWLWDNPY